ncbi:unnamed protein product, partial [marine sediment metagenome]
MLALTFTILSAALLPLPALTPLALFATLAKATLATGLSLLVPTAGFTRFFFFFAAQPFALLLESFIEQFLLT